MAEISSDTIFHLSHLARLAISDEEQQRYARQLSSVVEYIKQLDEVDTSEVSGLRGVTGLTNILAEDEPRAEDDLAKANRQELLSGAPAHDGDFFVVRAVMDSNEEAN